MSAHPNTNVYAHNVPLHWDKPEVEAMFSMYGTIISTRVLKNPATNAGRGICFVRYTSVEEATAAIEALNNKTQEGGTAPLMCKFANEGTGASSTPSYGAVPVSYGAARHSPYSRPTTGGGSDEKVCLLCYWHFTSFTTAA